MPPTKDKPAQFPRLREKSKNHDLFLAICKHYDPFQKRCVSFPLSVMAQARVWRRHVLPDENVLVKSLAALAEKGFREGQVELLIAYCESAIRPMKVAELEVEKLLPEMLFTKSATWPPNSAGFALLETEFFNQLKFFENTFGKRWVVITNAAPLSIQGRPPLIAPWAVGVTMKRWLTIKRILEKESETLAVDLASVLLGRLVRPEELRHWESLLNQVEITHEDGFKTLLPGYLIDIGSRIQRMEIGGGMFATYDWTPARYIKCIDLDEEATKALAKAVQKGWKRASTTSSKRRLAKTKARRQPLLSSDQYSEFQSLTCLRCHENISMTELYTHLNTVHRIEKREIESIPEKRELRIYGTREVLFRWEEA
jgi:hypothetical protein